MIATSFFSMFLGWLGAFFILALIKYNTGYPWFDDKEFWFFWPAFFVFMSWLIVVIPVLSITKRTRFFSDPRLAWLSWTLLAVIPGAVLVRTLLPLQMIWFPMVVGLIAGISYAALIPKHIPFGMLFPVPFIVVIFYQFLLWPMAQRYFTKYAYPLGSFEEQTVMKYNVLKKVKVGMSFNDLHELLPQEFDHPFTNRTGQGGGYNYKIFFDGPIISEIELKENNDNEVGSAVLPAQ